MIERLVLAVPRPKAAGPVSANSGQKPTFQSCRLVRNPSTCNGGHGRWGRSGRRLTNPSLYRSLLPDCPTVVVVRADHAVAVSGREGVRSVALQAMSSPPTSRTSIPLIPLELGGASDAAQSLAANRRATPSGRLACW